MAIIRELQARVLETDSRHTDAKCTYSVIKDADGTKLLHIDTYGSLGRKFPEKVSQSIRFSKEALEHLKRILAEPFSLTFMDDLPNIARPFKIMNFA
jgi:hypothetical protein